MNSVALLSRAQDAEFPEGRAQAVSSRKQTEAPAAVAGRWLEGLEYFVVALVVLAAMALHLRFVTEVGGLWRDETNSVNLATLPTIGEVWRSLDFDSFPVLYFGVLRLWTGIFGVGNDEMLRVLGLLTGLGGLVALWANARAFGSRLPLLSLALVGLNPMIVRYGDSNRAYGLGIFLILLTLRSFWLLVERPGTPSARRILAAAVLAILSVHCLYYNSVLLLAIAAGAVVVALRARAWRTAGIVLGLGALAAASLLPYAPTIIRMREWTFLVSYPATFSWLWKRAGEVMGAPVAATIWLWVGLVAIGLSVVGLAARRARLPAPVLFATVTLVVGVAGYAIFLHALNYYTQPWYYITLFAFAGCGLDVVFGAWPTNAKRDVAAFVLRGFRPCVALVMLVFTVPLSWYGLPTRHTNVDLVAGRIEALAKEGDLVVVPRWECAISFGRYYHGKAEVVTIPPIEDHRVHRYDLVLRQMQTSDADQPVLDRVEQTLRSGHRVFFADTLPTDLSAASIPTSHPRYQDPNGGWHGVPYNTVWKARLGRLVRNHALQANGIEIRLPDGNKVQRFENLEPGVAEGWH